MFTCVLPHKINIKLQLDPVKVHILIPEQAKWHPNVGPNFRIMFTFKEDKGRGQRIYISGPFHSSGSLVTSSQNVDFSCTKKGCTK